MLRFKDKTGTVWRLDGVAVAGPLQRMGLERLEQLGRLLVASGRRLQEELEWAA